MSEPGKRSKSPPRKAIGYPFPDEINSLANQRQVSSAGRTRKALTPQSPLAQASGISLPQDKRYVMLPTKKNSSMALQDSGPANAARSNTPLWYKKSRPSLKKTNSSKYVFSVDDDENEIEADINREYLEGFNDAMKQKAKRHLSRSAQQSISDKGGEILAPKPSNSALRDVPENAEISSRNNSVQSKKTEQHELEREIRSSLALASADLKALDQLDHGSVKSSDRKPPSENRSHEESPDEHDDQNDEHDDGDSHSISSLESFTLRERQDAINTTHPFGIRIWKPALYKKNRSIDTEAEDDIHSTPTPFRKIPFGVLVSNMIWIITFGLLLLAICCLGSLMVYLPSLVIPRKKKLSTRYAKAMYHLGLYFFVPFGKLVSLKIDENYAEEDQGEGTTLTEYQQWRSADTSRLFYASRPRRLSTRVTDEGSPLMEHRNDSGNHQALNNNNQAKGTSGITEDDIKSRFFGRGEWNIGRLVFYLYFYLTVQPLLLVISFFCWLGVFFIPMAKVTYIMSSHMRRHPLDISIEMESSYHVRRQRNPGMNESILICTYRSFGFHYYKYTVDGTNIFFINLIFMVLFVIFDFFVLKKSLNWQGFITDSSMIFIMGLCSVIPLAYFIGQAVASISAQTSMGVGAVINAFFSTIVEVFLYCVALNQEKGRLVGGSMIGSILAGVLLLPGLSMCGGAWKRKTQRYNPRSAGVSSTMLLYAITVMFAPTLLYQIYGEYELECKPCKDGVYQPKLMESSSCQRCHFLQPALNVDKLYLTYLRPFSVIVAFSLFIAYVIGLWFTLRTHAAMIWSTPTTSEKPKEQTAHPAPSIQSAETDAVHQNLVRSPTNENASVAKEEGSGGHDAPNWSRVKSTVILLGATVLYAIIAEILVDTVDVVLDKFPINPKFLGLTIFALVPNTTEFVNAISFAINGNVALSMEIGSAYALQVCLLQIPALVIFSLYANAGKAVSNPESMFTLIFPRWEIIASTVSVFLFTYIYAEGRSNYFKGSMLILIYLVAICGFYFADKIDTTGL